jgi:hypothetical protein
VSRALSQMTAVVPSAMPSSSHGVERPHSEVMSPPGGPHRE